MADKLAPNLENRIKAIKKLINKDPISNYINNGFYTNGYILIKDSELSYIPNENKILKNAPYTKLLNTSEIMDKIKKFEEIKYMERKMDKTEFNKFYEELKRFGFQQIKIKNGQFMLFDSEGHFKWQCRGYTEVFKNMFLQFDYKLFLNVMNYISEIKATDITLLTNKTYMMIKATAGASVTIYARGVRLEEVKDESNSEKSNGTLF